MTTVSAERVQRAHIQCHADKGTIGIAYSQVGIDGSEMGKKNRTRHTHLAKLERERRALRITSFHVALQIDVEEFKHQIEFLIRVHDIQ